MASNKILLIDTLHQVFTSKLNAAGFEIIDATTWSLAQIINYLPACIGIGIRSRFTIDKTFINAATQLAFICRAGAGMENIDVTYAESKNIACINSPEGNRDAVAEHTLGMLLMLQHKLMTANLEMRNGIWQRAENRGTELKNKTLAIIGFGNMGRAFAQRLTGFDMQVIAYDPHITIETLHNVRLVDLSTVFEQADIISL
ncbi:MAG TPA: NAD(P)-dependent oxidoreductase, partial [Bacteroidia bacterium]|nr:NAD(P)-dependent oxidoreductase [Bacteroidia bacterium]